MRLPFLNRQKEMERIEESIRSESAELIVVYGRRRLGKTRLLRRVVNQNDIYF
ncbi:MAG: ATP-binding protein, partial [Deltaproteobacteria bacterium]|nr:ATP-binding protein [Deltaproteobacteria bacterium]